MYIIKKTGSTIRELSLPANLGKNYIQSLINR